MNRPKRKGFSSQAVRDTLSTPGWKLIEARMRATAADLLEALTVDADPIVTAKARGELRGVRVCLDIPAILMQESGGDDDE